jgi:hypothetical protein
MIPNFDWGNFGGGFKTVLAYSLGVRSFGLGDLYDQGENPQPRCNFQWSLICILAF